MNAKRFIAISFFVTSIAINLYIWVSVRFPGRIVRSDPPLTMSGYALRCAAFVMCWPTMLIALFLKHQPGPGFYFLFIPSGLFWAAAIEFFFDMRKRRRAANALPPIGAEPASQARQ
jgi:hypothetical protein